MTPSTRRLRYSGLAASAIALVLLGAFWWGWGKLNASLPVLDGEFTLPGASAPMTLERDERGTVTIRAANRLDAQRALGFAHGQDRFFQMDLLRRRAAGELSELFGDVALPADRAAVVHRFRAQAEQVLANESAASRAQVEAYAAGVNAGLGSLGEKPWEYLVTGTEPRPWEPVDTALVFYAMVLDLQSSSGQREQTLATLRDVMGSHGPAFFDPVIGPSDSALDGSTASLPEPPDARAIDLRAGIDEPLPDILSALPFVERAPTGSNALAVAGSRTAHGAALLAGDPHLGLRVPNTWYRARLEWTDATGAARHVTGATLPGAPGVIIGSNGHLAWSFTNATVDTGDLVAVDLNQVAPDLLYHHGDETLRFETHTDVIHVKGGDDVEVESTWTIYGPISWTTAAGKFHAYKWTFHDPAACNFAVLELNTATSVDEGIAIAHRAGMPNQNIFLADAAGDAAWTLTGRIPLRFGYDGRFPVAWRFGDRGWDGYLDSAEIPVVRATADSAVWSGNQRMLGGAALERIGDNGYDDGLRAGQISTDLARLLAASAGSAKVAPADLFAIQLDDRADWIVRWRELLLATLDAPDAAPTGNPRATYRELLAEWDGHAAADSVAYRLMREWRDALVRMTFEPIFATSLKRDPAFAYWQLRYEDALWALHRDQPMHLLGRAYADWPALRLAAVDAAIARLDENDTPLAEATWGRRNTLRMTHPIGSSLPFGLGSITNMLAEPLPGDHRLPRVQSPTHGASLRMVVAPGQEKDGIMHLPGGQSGHPLSPFYRAGHRAWAAGEPLPFLPGPVQHTLTLTPGG